MAGTSKLAFSAEEFGWRLAATRRAMAQREVDVFLVDQQEHVAYLTGYAPPPTRYQACLVPLEGEPRLLVRPLDEPKVHAQSWLQSYTLYPDSQESMSALQQLIRAGGWADRRIGLEKDSLALSVEQFERLQALLPGATFVDLAGSLASLRLRKSAEEVAYHRQAASIADSATMQAIQTIWEGGTEREATLAAYATMLAMGADDGRVGHVNLEPSRPPSGNGNADEAGRLINVELIPQVRGYSSRVIRTAVLGQPSARQLETAQELIAIHAAQLAAMYPGAVAKEVDRICREGVLRAQMRESYDGVTGHTLGFGGTARPTDLSRAFLPTSDWAIEAGMIFHMYTRGRGIGLSETVLITEQGPERLTQLERALLTR